MYDYIKAMKEDIIDYFDSDDYNEEEDYLYDALWAVDAVTGNGSTDGYSGANDDEIKSFVLDNMKLAVEACREFDCINEFANRLADDDYRWIDATIRCYCLGDALSQVISDRK